MIAHVWDMYETNVVKVLREWHMLSFAYKWLGESTVHVRGLPDYPRYKKSPHDDECLVKELWELFNQADVIIGHNSDKFDIKKSNARFIRHGLKPPPPHKTIDTLKIARKHFKFDSNKLDSLGEYLGVGRKNRTGGIDLWLDCLAGDEKAWKKMKSYNKQDVVLLENVYDKLKPWFHTHLAVHIPEDQEIKCTVCGSLNMQRRGWSLSRRGHAKAQRYQCKDCGKWMSGPAFKINNL